MVFLEGSLSVLTESICNHFMKQGMPMSMPRPDGRRNDELRLLKMTPGVNLYAEGSVLVEMGQTRVLCTVSVEERVPPFLKDQGKGWVTAEYGAIHGSRRRFRSMERSKKPPAKGNIGRDWSERPGKG